MNTIRSRIADDLVSARGAINYGVSMLHMNHISFVLLCHLLMVDAKFISN